MSAHELHNLGIMGVYSAADKRYYFFILAAMMMSACDHKPHITPTPLEASASNETRATTRVTDMPPLPAQKQSASREPLPEKITDEPLAEKHTVEKSTPKEKTAHVKKVNETPKSPPPATSYSKAKDKVAAAPTLPNTHPTHTVKNPDYVNDLALSATMDDGNLWTVDPRKPDGKRFITPACDAPADNARDTFVPKLFKDPMWYETVTYETKKYIVKLPIPKDSNQAVVEFLIPDNLPSLYLKWINQDITYVNHELELITSRRNFFALKPMAALPILEDCQTPTLRLQRAAIKRAGDELAFGLTFPTPSSNKADTVGRIISADIVISSGYIKSFYPTNVANEEKLFHCIFRHELGHALGLGHDLNEKSLMKSGVGSVDTEECVFSSDDLKKIEFGYL